MAAFEKFLESKGYVRYGIVIDKSNKAQLHVTNSEFYSTMPMAGRSYLDYTFVNGAGKKIIYGLHEAGLPPTLISPRPVLKYEDGECYVYNDYTMARVLQNVPFEDILKAIETQKPLKINFDPTQKQEEKPIQLTTTAYTYQSKTCAY